VPYRSTWPALGHSWRQPARAQKPAAANDTRYKQALLARLTQAFADESLARVGELELVGTVQSVQCELVFDGDWRGTLNARQFAAAAT
jgi:hypothetical protein